MAVQIVINQSGKSAGVAGQAREDLDTGTAVLVAAVGGPFLAYQWSFQYRAINIVAGARATSLFATPTASSSLINPIDQPGTYLIQLAVDSGSGLGATEEDVATITFYAGPTLNADPTLLPRRIPAFRERLQHNVPDVIDPTGNTEGWSREWLRWFAYIETLAGGGGSVPVLSTAQFIDIGSAAGTPDGSIGKPWATIDAAASSTPVAAPTVFLITPGDYSAGAAAIFGSWGFMVALSGMAPPFFSIGTALVQLPEISALGGNLLLTDVSALAVTTSSLQARGCLFNAVITVSASAAMQDCAFNFGFGTIIECTAGGDVVFFERCKFNGSPVILFSGAAGEAVFDRDSYESWVQAQGTVTNGTVTAPQASLPEFELASGNNDDVFFGNIVFWQLCYSATVQHNSAIAPDHISGMVAPTQNDFAVRAIFFRTSAVLGTIDILHESSLSAPENRIITTTGSAVVAVDVTTNFALLTFVYDFTVSRWRLLP